MKKILFILLFTALFFTVSGTHVLAAESASQSTVTYPTFVIKAVEKNKQVMIQTENLRLNDTYIVTMGKMGTKGVGGYKVATLQTAGSGKLSKTFSIPAVLKDVYQIAIRLESPTTGFYAYNWFYNSDVNLNLFGTSPVPPTTPQGYVDIPFFLIKSVEKDKSVTITPYHFPPNQTFDVRMNWMHTQGIAGMIVETVKTDENGKLSDTHFAIPDFLKGSYQISIRLQSPASGYYAYNWFYNSDAP